MVANLLSIVIVAIWWGITWFTARGLWEDREEILEWVMGQMNRYYEVPIPILVGPKDQGELLVTPHPIQVREETFDFFERLLREPVFSRGKDKEERGGFRIPQIFWIFQIGGILVSSLMTLLFGFSFSGNLKISVVLWPAIIAGNFGLWFVTFILVAGTVVKFLFEEWNRRHEVCFVFAEWTIWAKIVAPARTIARIVRENKNLENVDCGSPGEPPGREAETFLRRFWDGWIGGREDLRLARINFGIPWHFGKVSCDFVQYGHNVALIMQQIATTAGYIGTAGSGLGRALNELYYRAALEEIPVEADWFAEGAEEVDIGEQVQKLFGAYYTQVAGHLGITEDELTARIEEEEVRVENLWDWVRRGDPRKFDASRGLPYPEDEED